MHAGMGYRGMVHGMERENGCMSVALVMMLVAMASCDMDRSVCHGKGMGIMGNREWGVGMR